MIKQHSRQLNLLLGICDLALTALAFYLAYWFRFEIGLLEQVRSQHRMQYAIVLACVLPLWPGLFSFFHVYQSRRHQGVFADFRSLFLSISTGVTFICAFSFFYREISYSRLTFVWFGVLNFIFIFGERVALRAILHHLRKRGYNLRQVLIVGAGPLGRRVAQRVLGHPEMGYHIVGLLDDHHAPGVFRNKLNLEVLGKTHDIAKIMERHQVDKVIIALPMQAVRKIAKLVKVCEREGVAADIVPDFFKFIQPRTRVQNFAGLPLVSVRATPVDSFNYRVGKRIFDIVFSVGVLIISAPLLLLIALLVKLTSPGPTFFSQERYGAHRRPFRMLKFRTMRVQTEDHSNMVWTKRDDQRVTVLGAFLRRTSLDELPQFWNVLRGDMSVVGPRPERPFFAQQFKSEVPAYMVRHQVKTGITGWAQVNGWRGDTSIKRRVEHDLYYIENWTFALDLKIILMTVLHGLVNKNAY